VVVTNLDVTFDIVFNAYIPALTNTSFRGNGVDIRRRVAQVTAMVSRVELHQAEAAGG
jgi:hypothetical protein